MPDKRRTLFRRITSGDKIAEAKKVGALVTGEPVPNKIVQVAPVQAGSFTPTVTGDRPFSGFLASVAGTLGPIMIYVEKVQGEGPICEVEVKGSKKDDPSAIMTFGLKQGYNTLDQEFLLEPGDLLTIKVRSFEKRTGGAGELEDVFTGFKFVADKKTIKTIKETGNAGNDTEPVGDAQ